MKQPGVGAGQSRTSSRLEEVWVVVFCFPGFGPEEGTNRHGNGCVAFFRAVAPRHLIGTRQRTGRAVVDAAKMFQLIDRIRPRPLAVSTTPSSARLREEEKKK